MKIKSALLLLFLMALNSRLIAKDITPAQARQVAANLLDMQKQRLKKVSVLHKGMPIAAEYKMASIDRLIGTDSEFGAYVVELEPQGFIIVAANTKMMPILAYSFTTRFSSAGLLYNLILLDLKKRLRVIENQTSSHRQAINRKWEQWLDNSTVYSSDTQMVWPEPGTTLSGGWIKTFWHQGSPYNARCPYDTTNSRKSVVGCVALAMAQIINYHGFPKDVKDFSDSDDYMSKYKGFKFDVDDDCGINGTLKWAELNEFLNNISYPIYNASTDELIDEFCYACGASLKIQYSGIGTRGYASGVARVLKNRYSYYSAEWKKPDDIDFFDVLQANIKTALPVQMVIFSETAGYEGHSIIVDGLDEMDRGPEDDLYHLNYGCGFQNETWWYNLFPFQNIDPVLPADYNQIAGAVVNIRPYDKAPQKFFVQTEFIFDSPGWYLISLPVLPSDTKVSTLFPTAIDTFAYTWEAKSKTYLTSSTLSPKRAYWLGLQRVSNKTIEGLPVESMGQHFQEAGWHLIGSPLKGVPVNQLQAIPADQMYLPLFTWDAALKQYVKVGPADTLKDKVGYWAAIQGECDLVATKESGGLADRISNEFKIRYGATPPLPIFFKTDMALTATLPKACTLYQNYPNPFNPVTTIAFDVPNTGWVEMTIYNTMGEKVKTLVNTELRAGTHDVKWDGLDESFIPVSSGVYIYRIKAIDFIDFKKMILIH